MVNTYAPGMRVEIRDEEWVIRKVDTNSSNTQTIYATGLSGIVKGYEAIFLSEIEKVKVIDPVDTQLILDDSPAYINSKLYIESKLRKRTSTGEKLTIGHKGAMNMMDYQIEPAVKALERPRQRILLADGVGLGKTLEAGILVSELMARGKGKRILVVALKSMMLQFQKEFWTRFTIPLKRLDSNEIQRIRARIPANHNPFYYHDKTIISIDTLKRDIEYRTYLENTKWDIIIIDEAHNVASRGKRQAQRSKLAERLSTRSDTLIMLSATPHDGKPASFASLMNMLDPMAIANEEDYTKEDIKGMVFRRFKKDIQDQVSDNFRERKVYREICNATTEEEAAFDYFSNLSFYSLDKRRTAGSLFKTTLEKSMFSSPAACIKTIDNRIKRLKKALETEEIHGTDNQRQEDNQKLKEMKRLLEKITPEKFSRYQKLIHIIQSKEYAWDPKDKEDRIVIFSERIETMKFLKEALARDLKMKPAQIIELHGGLSDMEQQAIVDEFGATDSDIRILVASDVASEGINLHYLSHRMIHFDLPWSLMVFQQRNGRIDRYGQEQTPDIRYIITQTDNERINGDLRILEILVEKEEQAYRNIGDPATIMKKYDTEAEEAQTAKAIEDNMDADDFAGLLDTGTEEDPFLSLINAISGSGGDTPSEKIQLRQTIFSDSDYTEQGLKWITQLQLDKGLTITPMTSAAGMKIKMGTDLASRMKTNMPEEVYPANHELRLTTDVNRIEKEIKAGRQKKENTWPNWQYLWPLHPITDWIADKIDTSYKRRQAPLIKTDELKSGEHIFITEAIVPNRRSEPVIDQWHAIRFTDTGKEQIIDLDELLAMKMFREPYPNPNKSDDALVKHLQGLICKAVAKTRELTENARKDFEKETFPKLEEELKNLERLKEKHYEQISLFEQTNESTRAAAKAAQKRRRTDQLYNEYYEWINDTMLLEADKPYIRIVAVLSGGN